MYGRVEDPHKLNSTILTLLPTSCAMYAYAAIGVLKVYILSNFFGLIFKKNPNVRFFSNFFGSKFL